MKPINCTDCGEQQYSGFDQDYFEKYNTCWGCDKERWGSGEMSLEQFEEREEAVAKDK